jgi:predicted ATP-binding protein involved in virulence
MKLSKIEITNFRCFESFALELRPDINVVVGVNGAGKTTILDSIAAALYDVVAANGGGGKRQRGWQKANLQPSDIHITPGSASAVVGRKGFVQFKAAASDFYEVPGFPGKTPAGDPTFLEWTDHIKYLPPAGFSYDTSKSERLSSVYQYFDAVWQELRRSDPAALIPLPVVAYYRASRRLTEMPKMGNVFELELSREGAFDHALNAGADFQAMCQWFYLRENAELREKAQVRHDPNYQLPDLKAAREALLRTLEDVTRVYFDENPPSLKVAFARFGQTDETMELTQLSDGYRSLLALVLDFARRLSQAHPNWPNPLAAPGILLIDEIELHLHPKWQQSVIPNLRTAFPNTQIIAATHSPEVLTTVRRENIQLLGIDHAIEQIPADVGTFGAESSRVLQEVFAAHVRPPHVETVGHLQEYLSLVESQQQDTERGRKLRTELEEALGRSDPDLLAAEARISQLKAPRGK